nr:uncharacterized protein LOC109162486 [Ipomoea batatas]
MQSYTVVDPQGDDAGKLKRFKENLHVEFERVPHIKLSALDLSYRIDIIDNSSKSVTNDLKYGSVPSDLQKYIAIEYLKSEAKEWDCGLVKGNRSQIDRLRVKYASAIFSAKINELRGENKDKAMKFS